MRQKLQFLSQILLLVFLPDLVAGHATFRSIARENTPQMPVVSPCYTRTILVSSEGRDLQFTSNSISFSPQSFHVLRI
jgi:hypothetical protein